MSCDLLCLQLVIIVSILMYVTYMYSFIRKYFTCVKNERWKCLKYTFFFGVKNKTTLSNYHRSTIYNKGISVHVMRNRWSFKKANQTQYALPTEISCLFPKLRVRQFCVFVRFAYAVTCIFILQ